MTPRTAFLRVAAATLTLFFSLASPSPAQDVCIRIMEQDSTLNNLVDPPGYRTAAPGTLGGVAVSGTGTRAMILIPGLGFGGDIFREFTKDFEGSYRIYAVTLAGFGGTAAPPSPDATTSFGAQTWTNHALSGIEKLMADEKITDAVVVGHWLTGTQLALRLAMKHPDRVRAVVLLAGAAKLLLTNPAQAPYFATLEKRVAATDRYSAPMWFKTVTRETWDDNNFLPGDYAANPVRGLRLWREAAEPPLHVWVRYLLEFQAQDVTVDLPRLSTPTLLLQPGLEGLFFEPDNNYMELFCRKSWEGAVEKHPAITVRVIPQSRACPWFDRPQDVRTAVTEFLDANRPGSGR